MVQSRNLVYIVQAILYFTDHHFAAFYRLLYKIANLHDIGMKSAKIVFDFNIYNPAKFYECMSRNNISKNWVFAYFVFRDKLCQFSFSILLLHIEFNIW